MPKLAKAKKVSQARLKNTLKANTSREKKLQMEVRRKRTKEEKKEEKKEQKKEEKKLASVGLERRMLRRIMFTPRVKEEKKPVQDIFVDPEVAYADAATQTEQLYFQKARAKWVMSKYGKSQAQFRRSTRKVLRKV